MNRPTAFIVCVLSLIGPASGSTQVMKGDSVSEPTGTLDQGTALSLAILYAPSLEIYSLEIGVEDAHLRQAGLRPNPEIEFEAEGFGGSRNMKGTEALETTLRLTQPIELGGKRSKRLHAASLTRDLARWDFESAVLDVLTETRTRFIDVLVAQERLELHEDLVRMASQALRVTEEQVHAGKASPLDETRAFLALTKSQIGMENSKNALSIARKNLSAMWAGHEPVFERAVGELDAIQKIPDLPDLIRLIQVNPNLLRWETEVASHHATVSLEKARTIPDLGLSAGLVHENETHGTGFLVGVSIPLPLFNRNQAGVREARTRLAQATKARAAAELEIRLALGIAHDSLINAHSQVGVLRERVIPAYENTYGTVMELYRQGKLGYLDVLDARGSLVDARSELLDALAQFHQAAIQIENLIAGDLPANEVSTQRTAQEEEHE